MNAAITKVAVLVTTAALAACGSRPEAAPGKPPDLDLLPRLALALEQAGRQSGRPGFEVTRGGVRRRCAVLIAPAQVAVRVGGVKGSHTLELVAAPVFNIGDGVDLEVTLNGPAGARLLLSRRFDPARRADDRAWQKIGIPLDLTGAPDETIQFRLAGGPAGDLVDDWLALGAVRLVN